MAKGMRKCKVCGVEYEYCHTVRNGDLFRYQDVACCPEHGSIYFARILDSRKANHPCGDDACDPAPSLPDSNEIEENEEDEKDEFFEEDFDGDGEE